MCATVEQVHIQIEVLNLINLVHTHFDRIYTIFWTLLTKKQYYLSPSNNSSTTPAISPLPGSNLQFQGQLSSGLAPPSPPSFLPTLSFICKGILAYLLNILLVTCATKVLSLPSSAMEITSEVSLISHWKRGFPHTATEEAKILRAGMKSTEKGNCISRLCSRAPLSLCMKAVRVVRSRHGKFVWYLNCS